MNDQKGTKPQTQYHPIAYGGRSISGMFIVEQGHNHQISKSTLQRSMVILWFLNRNTIWSGLWNGVEFISETKYHFFEDQEAKIHQELYENGILETMVHQ